MTGDSRSEIVGVRRMEVVQTGRRRRWSDEQKLRIVEEAAASGASFRAVARRHDIDPGQIYTWRKLLREMTERGNEGFAAVTISPDAPVTLGSGLMDVHCRNGRRITVGRDVDVRVLAQVVAALDQ
jgi:transposase